MLVSVFSSGANPGETARQSPGRGGDATFCKPPGDGRVVVEPHAAKARVVTHAGLMAAAHLLSRSRSMRCRWFL